MAAITRPLAKNEIAVRAIYLQDKSVAERSQWVQDVFPDTAEYKYKEDDTSILSHYRENFETVVVHGDDARRMARILKVNRAITRSKVNIAVMAKSMPPDRAILLNGGFDDVFDMRMDTVEATARVRSIMRRRRIIFDNATFGADDTVLDRIGSYVTAKLSPRELELFTKLVKNSGRAVSGSDLRRSASKTNPDMNENSIQVFICRLRKKLRPGVEIRSNYDGGYTLSIET
ncbi:MAG: winged helix-turn-helix domain-containing protein [Novosphingobium sp.]